ncbi:hypothetical protein [Methylosinus sp. Ce-a6]|uniref:hypothetical protein n=1 Tax=Methylosinus sp. Ce-a6 TaxID=2172005 RepID=UPI001359757A|nr:hypothetical protein [Methylosinus sp. Ce-a6]
MTAFCTADEIATAIVAAARLEGEDPEAVARGVPGCRARWLAFAALVDAFPGNAYRAIAVGVGIFTQSTMVGSRALLASYRRGKGPIWWDEAKIAAIRLAVTAASQETAKSSDGGVEGHAERQTRVRPRNDLGRESGLATPLSREIGQPPMNPAGVEPGPSEAVTPLAPCALPEDVPLGKSAPAAAPILRDVDAIPAPPRSRPRSSRGDVTAAICGDPPPERSALAQKRGAA